MESSVARLVFRWCNGELQIIPDADTISASCDMSYESDRWRAILPDGSLTTPGGDETSNWTILTGDGCFVKRLRYIVKKNGVV